MKITIIGTGYVGLVTGACLADAGNDVLCLDLDESKIKILREGGITFHEPELPEMLQRNITAGRLSFTTNIEESVAFALVQFIAVGTPSDEDGSADMKHVVAAASGIGRHMTSEKVIVNKSTVPVGAADMVCSVVAEQLKARGVKLSYHVVSNPEFLKEGAAIEDFKRPDRIVIGADHEHAIDIMRQIYAPFRRGGDSLIVMGVRSAELTKYAANAMLATRISFMNELANLAEALDADIDEVRRGIGSDPRIGDHFLYSGCGYGGSCFPKDVKALLRTAAENGHTLKVISSVQDANDTQKVVLVSKIIHSFGRDLSGKRFAIWGLAFKPDTDDMREAPSRTIIEALRSHGATICAYDPAALPQARLIFGSEIDYAEQPMQALEGADALVIVTEWREFRSPDFVEMAKLLKTKRIFDGRNMYSPADPAAAGLFYDSIGRRSLSEET